MSRFVPGPNFAQVADDAAEPGLVKVAGKITAGAARNVSTDTGYYADSLRVEVDNRGVVAETTDFAGHIIEWGSIDHPPQAPIRSAASELGRFEPK